MPREIFIDKKTSSDLIWAGPCATLERDWEEVLTFASPVDVYQVPEEEWRERIEEGERDQSFLSHVVDYYQIQYKNQAFTNYCHAAATVGASEAVMAWMQLPHRELSIASVGGPATGHKNPYPPKGQPAGVGASVQADLRVAVELGMATTKTVPNLAVDKKLWLPGFEQERADCKVTEWYDFGMVGTYTWKKVMSMLFARIPVVVGYNWWGHAVYLLDPAYKNGQFCVKARNSWTNYGINGYFWLGRDKGTPDQAFAPRQISIGGKTIMVPTGAAGGRPGNPTPRKVLAG